MTPLRLSILRFLATKPGGYSPKGLVRDLCPRPAYLSGHRAHWTEQGAARMAGKITKPLRDAGLIKLDHWARMCDQIATITDAGRELLAQHDEAASRAELDRAINSGS